MTGTGTSRGTSDSEAPGVPRGSAKTPRVQPVDPSALTEQQQQVFDRIADSRGRVEGPFTVLLHTPELAERVQRLGAYLRYEATLERDLAEAAVLVVAKARDSAFEWSTHEPPARRAGTPDSVIEAIRVDADPASLPDPYGVVCAYARALATLGRVPDELYQSALATLGDRALVELTLMVGYYTMLAMTLGAHDLEPRQGA